jgi:hypothetical protein
LKNGSEEEDSHLCLEETKVGLTQAVASFASLHWKKSARPCLLILLDKDIGNYDDGEYWALV